MNKVWLVAALLTLPLGASAASLNRDNVPWYMARQDSTGLAPDPATTREAVLQVYAARTVGWRGVFAVHTWISVKPSDAQKYTRYEVIGFGVDRGLPAIRIDRMGPDNYWFGAAPELLLDRRGDGVDALIEKVQAAVKTYPWPDEYTTWPGPNSNTFTAWIAREVPELRLSLPSIAIGKDYLGAVPVGRAPSGTGGQLSLFGVAGAMVALDEGLEVNLLGLVVGLDVKAPAILLPLIGRLGMPRPVE
jgi:Protein of unknown function (DUF3750)